MDLGVHGPPRLRTPAINILARNARVLNLRLQRVFSFVILLRRDVWDFIDLTTLVSRRFNTANFRVAGSENAKRGRKVRVLSRAQRGSFTWRGPCRVRVTLETHFQPKSVFVRSARSRATRLPPTSARNGGQRTTTGSADEFGFPFTRNPQSERRRRRRHRPVRGRRSRRKARVRTWRVSARTCRRKCPSSGLDEFFSPPFEYHYDVYTSRYVAPVCVRPTKTARATIVRVPCM